MSEIDQSIVASAIGALVHRPIVLYDEYCSNGDSMTALESLDLKAFHATSLVGRNYIPEPAPVPGPAILTPRGKSDLSKSTLRP